MKNNPALSFRTVVENAAIAHGLDPEAGQVEVAFAQKVARAVDYVLERAWTAYAWPQVCRVVTDLSLLLDGYLVLGAYAEDPVAAWAKNESPRAVDWRVSTDGALALKSGVTAVWYYVQLARPRMGSREYDELRMYQPREVCYELETGQCWMWTDVAAAGLGLPPAVLLDWAVGASYTFLAFVRGADGLVYRCFEILPHTATAASEPGVGVSWTNTWQRYTWQVQRVPEFLESAVLAGVAAWLAGNSDNQWTNAAALEQAVDRALEDQAFRLVQQGYFKSGRPLALR